MIKTFFIKEKGWLWPILFVAFFTPWSAQVDLAIAHYFYDGNGHFSNHPFYLWMFDYGVLPAKLLCAGALILFLGSFVIKRWQRWRATALAFVLILAVGAGLITHVILKDHWGRPRPKQVVEFGGSQAFRPYYEPNFFHQPQPSKSFPCGHCTMGFYFFSVALLGKRLGSQKLYVAGMVLAIALGGLLSWTRMAQGGHFFSDTLISALIMWLTAYGFFMEKK